MNIMELVEKNYKGTTIPATELAGMGTNIQFDLDCNNGGDDCSIGDYCES